MPVPIVREYVEHRGVKYFRTQYPTGKEYWYSSRVKAFDGKRMLLHRVLWEEAYGPIPDGCEIHHKDENGLNNDLGNLEALTRSGHVLAHGARGAWGADAATRGERTRGMWSKRAPRTVVCTGCGAEFSSTGMRAMFCSRPCRRSYYQRERGY